MPYTNTDEPFYDTKGDWLGVLKRSKKKAFDAFVRSAMASKEMSEEDFARAWNARCVAFSRGVFTEGSVMVDIIALERQGYTLDLRALFEVFLAHHTGDD